MISVLGIITARGGSKSIPRKNIVDLGGKPLIGYTVEAARASKLTRTILSTDDVEIAEVGRNFGLEVPFMRPKELAQDRSTSIEAVQHALGKLEEDEGIAYDYVMILQPTSPFRSAEDIDACIDLAIEKDADSVMSMVELEDFSPKKLKYINDDGLIVPCIEEEGKTSGQRQEARPVFKRNAAVYLTKVTHIKNGDLFGERSYAYVMPHERSIDINAPIDLQYAEFLLSKK